jgi:hypothetical protein
MTDGPTIHHDGDHLVVCVPMQLKRRGGRKQIVVPEGLPGSRASTSAAQEPLTTALARAFHWQDLIDSGAYSSITELAEALGVDRSYVGRIMRLTMLAPDIVTTIVDGREASGLSLERLVKGMSVVWEEQRERLAR